MESAGHGRRRIPLARASTKHPPEASAVTGTPSGDATCVTLFCKLDAHPLQRLVGTERAARMIKSQQESSFLFR